MLKTERRCRASTDGSLDARVNSPRNTLTLTRTLVFVFPEGEFHSSYKTWWYGCNGWDRYENGCWYFVRLETQCSLQIHNVQKLARSHLGLERVLGTFYVGLYA
jgi:hypothetical protein